MTALQEIRKVIDSVFTSLCAPQSQAWCSATDCKAYKNLVAVVVE